MTLESHRHGLSTQTLNSLCHKHPAPMFHCEHSPIDQYEGVDIRIRPSEPAIKTSLPAPKWCRPSPERPPSGPDLLPTPGLLASCATWFLSAPAHSRWRTRKRPGRDLGLDMVPPDLYLGSHVESTNCRLNFGRARLTFTLRLTRELVVFKHSSLWDNDDVCLSWRGLRATCLQSRAKLRILAGLCSFPSPAPKGNHPDYPLAWSVSTVSCSARHGPPTYYGRNHWPTALRPSSASDRVTLSKLDVTCSRLRLSGIGVSGDDE